ncbi:MAG: hypothetical protein JW966_13320 [Anaerolineae bacterium]|nr:hypothetical protein [Anaerolineae bacterium]
MKEKAKRDLPGYTVDFETALPLADCTRRLERDAPPPDSSRWAPLTQHILIRRDGTFILERRFPWALYPIRLVGHLDPVKDSDGTWVHGAITHDTVNQVMIEGLIVFLLFFLATALLFLRLKTRGLVITVPLLLVMLSLFSLRWRALRAATENAGRWLRRRLYVTQEQLAQ